MYNEFIGKLHFWVMFIGVNLVFFRSTSSGWPGMLRRYIDYPDAFAGWNYVLHRPYIPAFGVLIFPRRLRSLRQEARRRNIRGARVLRPGGQLSRRRPITNGNSPRIK